MGGDWRDKAGSLMCVGLDHAILDDDTKAHLDAGVSGILLMERALLDAEGVGELTHAIKRYAGRAVFVAVDHEVIQGLGPGMGFTRFPPGWALGEREDEELARRVGQLVGRELRAVGVDLTLGPTLDVATEISQETRLMGSDPDLVSRLSQALVEGQQAEGVAACVKHFPGRGMGGRPSGNELGRVPHGFSRLDEVELKPFRAAIDARVAGMMVGHVIFEALDDQLPASLSRAIIFGLLRQRMSYRGMVMLDDLDAGPLLEHHSLEQVGSLGVMSGADCFLCAKRPKNALRLIEFIERGIERGEILPERLEAARRRIAPLLHRYVADPGPRPDLSVLGAGNALDLDPGVDATAHVRPGSLARDE